MRSGWPGTLTGLWLVALFALANACTDSGGDPVVERGTSGAGGQGSASGSAGGAGSDDREIDEYFLNEAPDPGGLAATPPMGWNSWNKLTTGINETLIREVAQAVVDSGMKDAGYTYINLDDGWSEAELDAEGKLRPSAAAFPQGMKSLADGIHGLGLKLGIYGDRGTKTCANRAGSEGNEARHAEQYAAWGIDYLKHDNCNAKAELFHSRK